MKCDYRLYKSVYERCIDDFNMVAGNSEMLNADAVRRRTAFQDLRRVVAAEVNRKFSDVLMEVGAIGLIDFDMGSSSDDGAVTMRVLFDAASRLSVTQGGQVDDGVLQTLESLSGGDKAFAILAFLMAAARVVRKSRGESRQSASHSTRLPDLPQRCLSDALTTSAPIWTTRCARCATVHLMRQVAV